MGRGQGARHRGDRRRGRRNCLGRRGGRQRSTAASRGVFRVHDGPGDTATSGARASVRECDISAGGRSHVHEVRVDLVHARVRRQRPGVRAVGAASGLLRARSRAAQHPESGFVASALSRSGSGRTLAVPPPAFALPSAPEKHSGCKFSPTPSEPPFNRSGRPCSARAASTSAGSSARAVIRSTQCLAVLKVHLENCAGTVDTTRDVGQGCRVLLTVRLLPCTATLVRKR